MPFDLEKAMDILERTPSVLRIWLEDLDEQWTGENEGEGSWSAFDILGHLIHGEETDWMVRVQHILDGKENQAFETFDRFAQFEKSKGKSLGDLLDTFEKLRRDNLTLLKELALQPGQMELQGIHPELGKVTLGQLLATWVVHDLGHIAQIARVMAHQYRGNVGPWTEYLSILKK